MTQEQESCSVRFSAVMPTAATAVSGQGAFMTGIVTWVAFMAASIARFVPLKVIERPVATLRQRPSIPVMGVPPIVDMPIEAMRPTEPGACADEDSVLEPIRPVVAVGRTVVRSVIKVPIRTDRSWSDVDAD